MWAFELYSGQLQNGGGTTTGGVCVLHVDLEKKHSVVALSSGFVMPVFLAAQYLCRIFT